MMNASFQVTMPTASILSASCLARIYAWIRRTRAEARARRALAQLDARTLRDIGLSHREIAVLNVMRSGRQFSQDLR